MYPVITQEHLLTGEIILMDLDEINELYAEEVALLKRIRSSVTMQPQGEPDRVEKVTLLLMFRIFSNLYSALLLTVAALKNGKLSFFQLSIGIVLRCCYTDCLFALYIQRVDAKRAIAELEMRTIEYANSMLERKEVYRDQVRSIAKEFDDELIDHFWELTMEDHFLGLLTFDENMERLTLTKQSKTQLKEAGFSKTKSIATKEMVEFLVNIPELEVVTTRLYHYYKYFSQYEHFSENGQGDVLASAKEDGNDNIHFLSAIRALSAGVEEVIKRMASVNDSKVLRN